MKIGIDISQIVYTGTGVARYVSRITEACVKQAPYHEFILFGASFRQKNILRSYMQTMQKQYKNVRTVLLSFPTTFMDILWNRLHIVPIQQFIGPVDMFWSSDWIQPPIGKAIGVTTIHDVSFFHFPESFDKKIITVQKRRLYWATKECSLFLCDSKATKHDVIQKLHLREDSCVVIYPGYTSLEKLNSILS